MIPHLREYLWLSVSFHGQHLVIIPFDQLRTPRNVRIFECNSSSRWSFCDSYTSSARPLDVDIGMVISEGERYLTAPYIVQTLRNQSFRRFGPMRSVCTGCV